MPSLHRRPRVDRRAAPDAVRRPARGSDARCITFLGAHRAALPVLPWTTPRGGVELHAFTDNEALSVSRLVGRTAGSSNALLERLFQAPATTRNWRTVVRLVEKFA